MFRHPRYYPGTVCSWHDCWLRWVTGAHRWGEAQCHWSLREPVYMGQWVIKKILRGIFFTCADTREVHWGMGGGPGGSTWCRGNSLQLRNEKRRLMFKLKQLMYMTIEVILRFKFLFVSALNVYFVSIANYSPA